MPENVTALGEIIHGTVVAMAADPDGPLAGVLLRGASGTGKSDLALRLIEACPWQRTKLVADDAVIITGQNGWLVARCPERLAGQIEIRGVGIEPAPSVAEVRLRLMCDLDESVPRLPETQTVQLVANTGICLPCVPLEPFEASSPAKLRYALRAVLARHFAAARQDGSSTIEKGQKGR